jgi:hypothetical protein
MLEHLVEILFFPQLRQQVAGEVLTQMVWLVLVVQVAAVVGVKHHLLLAVLEHLDRETMVD